jgi:hypothetical protein
MYIIYVYDKSYDGKIVTRGLKDPKRRRNR